MRCRKCNTRNKDDALYCVQCGASLSSEEIPPNTPVCLKCGKPKPMDHHYCRKWFADLEKRLAEEIRQEEEKERRRTRVRPVAMPMAVRRKKSPADLLFRWHPAWITLVLLIGTVALVSIMYRIGRNTQPGPGQTAETPSTNPLVEVRMLEIASRFACSCGNCGEESLDKCICPTAIEERGMIRKSLEAGQASDVVVNAVNSQYGWMKSASRLADRPGTDGEAAKRRSLADIRPDTPVMESPNIQSLVQTVVTVADRDRILSHFRCPCGKCGMENLEKCVCEHPHGAREIRAFLDARIQEGNWSSVDLIELIDSTFGGRKL